MFNAKSARTNPFLVESRDKLAITYNDNSPLENMHCAKLFEICSDPATNAFGKTSKEPKEGHLTFAW